ncbi:MAG: tRNA (adenosine(37)-N6)-threonylcarbamoyltransferase complex transferase subunit TsaD [Clostridiales bacterium]|jgi:N6-L-threonylcarbamoyladenine synthase|nr:tRNA (adenosine(37)-N6)-threonylcarbamoyltransferase complex transferase subunit TsaD [Clostridiales bacterium]
MKNDYTILAIETSCDETAAAVVRDGREVLSSVVYSQTALHAKYGGVVPELASRSHIDEIGVVTEKALKEAGRPINGIDAVAVTFGAGLAGALLVGVSYAKALAYAAEKPLIAVNHIQGHIAAGYIAYPELRPPFLCLVASGGHTSLVAARDYVRFEVLGSAKDDAAGEAFDKIARFIGLPYPGGPNLEKLAEEGKPVIDFYKHPLKPSPDFDFSFSGLKTAVVTWVKNAQLKGSAQCTVHSPQLKDGVIHAERNGDERNKSETVDCGLCTVHSKSESELLNSQFSILNSKADIAASFQKAAVDILVRNVKNAVYKTGLKTVTAAGGVAANGYFARRLEAEARKAGADCLILPKRLCGDNAAMIGAAAYYQVKSGLPFAPLSLNARPSLKIGENAR